MPYELIHGDCLEELKKMPDDSVDSIVTDPPYGLGTVKDLPGLLTAWMTGEDHLKHVGKGGFMNKEWDSTVPSPAVWKECLRVLKPGGHMLVFAGTRTQDLMGISVRLAGAELRDEISYFGTLNWVMGSGFPKSHDISKAIDRMAGAERAVVGKSNRHVSGKPEQKTDGLCGSSTFKESVDMGQFVTAPATEDAKKWNGYGTALKPAHEPILLFRKPLSEKNIAENVLKHGTGALNIDGCRVAMVGEKNPSIARYGSTQQKGNNGWEHKNRGANFNPESFSKGRWPANVILTHHPSCELLGMKKVKAIKGGDSTPPYASDTTWNVSNTDGQKRKQIGDENGQEIVEDWCCHEDCPVGMFPSPHGAGKARSGSSEPRNQNWSQNVGNAPLNRSTGDMHRFGDQGSAARFFYCAKASKRDRNEGLDEFEPEFAPTTNNGIGVKEHDPETATKKQNIHPTVKPTDLMAYLCRLVTPPGGTVLDPFMGSGSTGKGALMEGFDFIGIECEAEYVDIARRRIEYVSQQENTKSISLKKLSKESSKESEKTDRQVDLLDYIESKKK